MSVRDLKHMLTFECRKKERDGRGAHIGDFAPQFTIHAGIKFRRGGEEVEAARLQSKQPAVLKVRNLPDAKKITAAWRARTNKWVFEIKEHPTETDDSLFLEMLAERTRGDG